MKLLLDTHTLLWWMGDERRLSAKAQKAIASRASEIFVSAASAYEIAWKVRAGALPKAAALVMNFENELSNEGFLPLQISIEHGRRAGELAGAHRDPFDRLLAAQAIVEDMPIVSNDAQLAALGANRFW
jgi:PIN domain nuclease of toxin-antitoxin system